MIRDEAIHLISSLQLENFRNGKAISEEKDIRAEKGAYFISKDLRLYPKCEKSWMFVANVNQTISAINNISKKIKSSNETCLVNYSDIYMLCRTPSNS